MRYLAGVVNLVLGTLVLAVFGTLYVILLLLYRCLGISPSRLHRLEVWFARAVVAGFGQKLEIRPPAHSVTAPAAKKIYLMVPHTSFLDVFVTAAALPEYATGVGAKNYFRWPVIGWLLSLRMKPIDRNNHYDAIGTLNRVAEEAFAQGIALVIAPEGTRTFGDKMMEFKKGAFCVAFATGAEVIPVVITGARLSWPRGKLFPKRGFVMVKFLPPVTKNGFVNVSNMAALVYDKVEAELNHH